MHLVGFIVRIFLIPGKNFYVGEVPLGYIGCKF